MRQTTEFKEFEAEIDKLADLDRDHCDLLMLYEEQHAIAVMDILVDPSMTHINGHSIDQIADYRSSLYRLKKDMISAKIEYARQAFIVQWFVAGNHHK